MLLFNGRMLAIAGENGVAASTITFYVFGLMSALYMGNMFGISPLLSYFYGASDTGKLKRLRFVSLVFIGAAACVTAILSIAGSEALVGVFAAPGSPAYALAVHGNRLFSLALLLVGFNTFSSMLFTALSNGKISAIIILPFLYGINGLWLSVPVSELLAVILSCHYVRRYKDKYGY